MINQIGMLQEQGNTCKDLDWRAFRILKTDWLSLPDWQKPDWLTEGSLKHQKSVGKVGKFGFWL